MRSVRMLPKTYSNASLVLVIDKAIRQLRSHDSIHEKMFTIYVSPWIQRLWTMLEMMVASTLVFQISDDMLDYRELFSEAVLRTSHRDPLLAELLKWLGTMLIRFQPSDSAGCIGLDRIVWHVSRRASRKESDEILAIAGLFGLDPIEYFPLDAEERMLKFLRAQAQSRVPPDLIFWPGAKMALPGRRWAPRKFMGNIGFCRPNGELNGEMATVSDAGLFGRWQCLVLKDRLSHRSLGATHHRVIVEATGEAFIFEVASPPLINEDGHIDLIILAQAADDSGIFSGWTAQGTRNGPAAGDATWTVDLGCFLKMHGGNSDKFSKLDLPSSTAIWEPRLLLLR